MEHSKAKAVFTIPQLVPVVRDAIESGDSLTDLGKVSIEILGMWRQ